MESAIGEGVCPLGLEMSVLIVVLQLLILIAMPPMMATETLCDKDEYDFEEKCPYILFHVNKTKGNAKFWIIDTQFYEICPRARKTKELYCDIWDYSKNCKGKLQAIFYRCLRVFWLLCQM